MGGTVTNVEAADIFSPVYSRWSWGLLITPRDKRDYNRLCYLDGCAWHEDTGERGLTNHPKDGII